MKIEVTLLRKKYTAGFEFLNTIFQKIFLQRQFEVIKFKQFSDRLNQWIRQNYCIFAKLKLNYDFFHVISGKWTLIKKFNNILKVSIEPLSD